MSARPLESGSRTCLPRSRAAARRSRAAARWPPDPALRPGAWPGPAPTGGPTRRLPAARAWPARLGIRARHREDDGRRGQGFQARPRGDVQHAEVAQHRGRRGGLAAGGERPGPEHREHGPQRIGRVHLDRRRVHPEGGERATGGEEAADGVRFADGQAEFQRLLAEPRRLLGPAGQLSERGLPGQRTPTAPRVTQVPGQRYVDEQLVPACRVAAFQQRPQLGHDLAHLLLDRRAHILDVRDGARLGGRRLLLHRAHVATPPGSGPGWSRPFTDGREVPPAAARSGLLMPNGLLSAVAADDCGRRRW